jgi:polyisoprenoid-binding protein YceI
MKAIILFIVLTVLSATVVGQEKYFTKTGKISFYSKATLENIEAHNRSVTCVLDPRTGSLQFSVQIKGFEFEKALMQEHFNENYLESDKYPKAEFKGQITNNSEINYAADGEYNANVKGQLTIHGATKEVESQGKLTVKDGKIIAVSEFNVQLADYNIKNDKMNNISNTIRVTVNCSLEPLKG